MEVIELITKNLQAAGALPKPRKKIHVTYIESEHPLGTIDGEHYVIYPWSVV